MITTENLSAKVLLGIEKELSPYNLSFSRFVRAWGNETIHLTCIALDTLGRNKVERKFDVTLTKTGKVKARSLVFCYDNLDYPELNN